MRYVPGRIQLKSTHVLKYLGKLSRQAKGSVSRCLRTVPEFQCLLEQTLKLKTTSKVWMNIYLPNRSPLLPLRRVRPLHSNVSCRKSHEQVLDMVRQNIYSPPVLLFLLANLLIPVAILIFASGFFPYKPFLPGLAEYQEDGYPSPPEPPFQRLIFMVVDALRSDFVYLAGSGFEYTQMLIANGAAIPFTAHATSPTITMPRIKAMTTGSTPSFLDAILSFDEADTSSTLAVQDTWLAQMKAKASGKLVMHGDDTWLKLFPSTFDRADGTSSFFVSDFTEVDNNVTRHIADELRSQDWNTLVLHYLGLDHIGHKTGPRGPNMIPKQREMDGIVRQIFDAIETYPHLESTLLVLCGDHGMNDAGNHGASSPGETSAALVFASPKFKTMSKSAKVPADFVDDFKYYNVVEQSDLAPTLAALLGFPIPKNSLGSFIMDFLPFWPDKHDRFQILERNAAQLLEIVAATYRGVSPNDLDVQICLHPSSPALELVCEWQEIRKSADSTTSGNESDEEFLLDVAKWLGKAQAFMSGMASNYDLSRLVIGGLVALVSLIAALLSWAMLPTKSSPANLAPFAIITLLYGVMMFASSYVEEEQHFWYWTTSAWLLYLIVTGAPRRGWTQFLMNLAGIGLMRVIRSWNQTGQKFAGEPDLVTMFLVPNPSLLWMLVLATYAMVSLELYHDLKGLPSVMAGSVVAGLVTSAVSFKLAFTSEDAPELVVGLARVLLKWFKGPSLVSRARAVFFGIGLTSLYPVYLLVAQPTRTSKMQAARTTHHLYTLFALTQSRATNVPLFLLFNGIYYILNESGLEPDDITTSSLLLQLSSFFAMGGSNAFTGIDLSNAYNGVSGFNMFAVGVLTFVSNWAGPVWWTSASNLMLLSRRQGLSGKRGGLYLQHICLLTVFVSASLVFVMAACTAMRTHLFIWTVFSPKYLYSMAWSLGQHLVINIGLGGLLYRLSI
ncbi:GPI ethanolamine phosphate transferase [Xylariomycetidae sp. FL2044]|nr:GPI ethanolamine phosphate transferase [Xylariomycetidae sp. FL2044]